MKKTEYLLVGGLLLAIVVVGGIVGWSNFYHNTQTTGQYHFPDTKYGAFLAAQHAVAVNDFGAATKLTANLTDIDYTTVQSLRYLSEFLSGKMPSDVKLLKDERSAPARIIYDAYLVTQNDWNAVYKRHATDKSALSAPLRIWSSVATGKTDDALKFIAGLPTNDSWKSFIRAQIYAEAGDIQKAVTEFSKVRVDFININDYLYMMSFYNHNNMTDAANALHDDFTSRPGGMFMLKYDKIPDWSVYSGYKNALGFGFVQNVSHTQIMMYSDMSVLWLRFAQLVAPEFGADNSTINYYIGQFMFNNNSDYTVPFAAVTKDSPYYLFVVLRQAEKSDNVRNLMRVAHDNPLFVPAINKLIAHHTKHGNRRAALRTINRALDTDDLPEVGRIYFLKTRAQINYSFGKYREAQKDIRTASESAKDSDIIALQAKIWAARNKKIEDAYDYAIGLVHKNPIDVASWDALGRVIFVREGAPAALDLIERVGAVANTCSSLFELLGDLYLETAQFDLARNAYLRAIELSDDGLVVVPNIRKKLRKIK